MRNLKQEDFPYRKRLWAYTFFHKNYSQIRRRLHDNADKIAWLYVSQKKRQKDSENDLNSVAEISSTLEENYHNAQGKWGKKRSRDTKTESKTSSGQFQQSPTIHLSTNPNLKKKKSEKECL